MPNVLPQRIYAQSLRAPLTIIPRTVQPLAFRLQRVAVALQHLLARHLSLAVLTRRLGGFQFSATAA
jgi:hypothetical protein